MAGVPVTFTGVPYAPLLAPNGMPSQVWWQFFLALYNRAGISGQIPGTGTNDSANPGNIGEYLSSQLGAGAAVPLVSGAAKDITSIALTPGDWDVWGSIATTGAVTVSNGWINTASAADPGAPNGGCYALWGNPVVVLPIGKMRIEVPATTPSQSVFLTIRATFGGGNNAYGFLGARRAR